MDLELTTGGRTLLDPLDYAWAQQWKWRTNGTYAVRTVTHEGRGFTVYLHRVLLHAPTGLEVDHINGDGLDNRRENIRLVTHAQNMQNLDARSDSGTGVRGVFIDRRKRKPYYVRIKLGGVQRRFGHYATLEEAAAVAEEARRNHMTHTEER